MKPTVIFDTVEKYLWVYKVLDYLSGFTGKIPADFDGQIIDHTNAEIYTILELNQIINN